MIPLSTASSRGLIWSKISCSRSYELKLNDEVVGTLRRPSFWSVKFLAETKYGCWTFRRGGLLGSGAEIVDTASEVSIATFRSNWASGGALAFTDGQTFQLKCKGWWRPVWTVISSDGEAVLHLHTRGKTVELLPGVAVRDDRLLLLILFARYRALQSEEDATAAVVAATS